MAIFRLFKVAAVRYILDLILFALSLFANKTTNDRMLFITECIRRQRRLIYCL